MASSQLGRRLHSITKALPPFLSHSSNATPFSSLSAAADSAHHSNSTPEPTSLSARMSFLFQQIDEIDKQRQEKDQTLQRIRDWRETKKQQDAPAPTSADSHVSDSLKELDSELVKTEGLMSATNEKMELELVHPWPEWIELMERLVQQNYFDHRRKDEDGMMRGLGFDMSEVDIQEKGKGLDFTRDFDSVRTAAVNFGKDRFDILRSLSRQDLQILVGYGCPSTDKRVVFSSKLLRKHVHLDEGDVCSSCNMRSSCEKAYLLTNKEDEARTIDVIRILLTYGFDAIDGSVVNKTLVKMKSIKTSVRKLLHHVIKLSAVPIDPNLPPPIIKKPTPKVKQPPPPPKKKVGRYDIEMKKGDWLCTKCDFMNFAKNTVCLQCDAKRPKRQLLPGEWECPQCNFLNYRRNVVCFQCEHNRPPDTYSENRYPERQRGLEVKMDKLSRRTEVSSAWNFDFDDDESDGAEVETFENAANSQKVDEYIPSDARSIHENYRTHADGYERSSRHRKFEKEYSDSRTMRPGLGFNDFDEEDDDVDSYDVIHQNEIPETSRVDFSELEPDTESEDDESLDNSWHARGRTNPIKHGKKPLRPKANFSDSEEDGVDVGSDDELLMHLNRKSSHVAKPKRHDGLRKDIGFSSDDDLDFSNASDDETLRFKEKGNHRRGFNKPENARQQSFRSRSFPDAESGDEFSHNAGLDRTGKSHRGRDGMKKFSLNNSFDRPSGSLRNNRGIQEKSYNERSRLPKDSKFRSHRKGGSMENRGGISNRYNNKSDSYLDDERYQRPRMNVR
ncbi:hypothetical protein F511_32598 [Dorcoceras hygrometricum]|uniref:RanBP2-type domain-containing protein n=1 Tax=Dorcoceras hygrometricum TaxID=472368 RepID=A0A2Z7CZL8_9LAMI|nr:hypothetical protein F511_32598 [Dorcoceras hygrometricum]